MSRLKLENGKEISELNNILDEQKRFYQKLYTNDSNKVEEKEMLQNIFLNNNKQKLIETENESIEGEITEEEL